MSCSQSLILSFTIFIFSLNFDLLFIKLYTLAARPGTVRGTAVRAANGGMAIAMPRVQVQVPTALLSVLGAGGPPRSSTDAKPGAAATSMKREG